LRTLQRNTVMAETSPSLWHSLNGRNSLRRLWSIPRLLIVLPVYSRSK
jgi:hypothetical protein